MCDCRLHGCAGPTRSKVQPALIGGDVGNVLVTNDAERYWYEATLHQIWDHWQAVCTVSGHHELVLALGLDAVALH